MKNLIEKLKNIVFIIKILLKILIILIRKLIFYYEKFLGTIFPPLKWWYNFRDSIFEYEKKEREVFIKHMPNWYKVYETHPIFIILRILTLVFFVLISRDIFRDYFAMRFHLDSNANTLFTYNTVLNILEFCLIIIYLCFIILKIILRSIYFKEIVYNSPFNWKHSVINGAKNILVSTICISILGQGTNRIDDVSMVHGYVPPFRHYSDSMSYYLSGRVPRPLGTESLDKYELFESKNPVINYLRGEQIKSLEKRHELMEIYNLEQKGKEILVASKKARREEEF